MNFTDYELSCYREAGEEVTFIEPLCCTGVLFGLHTSHKAGDVVPILQLCVLAPLSLNLTSGECCVGDTHLLVGGMKTELRAVMFSFHAKEIGKLLSLNGIQLNPF